MTINSEKPNTSDQHYPQSLSDVRLPLTSTVIAQKVQSGCSVEFIAGELSEPMYSFQQVDLSQSLILHSITGSAVCQFADGTSTIITPGTTIETSGSLRSVLVFGRGIHQWIKVTKPIPTIPQTEQRTELKIINQLTRPCAIFEQLTTALVNKVSAGLIEGPYLGAWLHFVQECPTTLYERPYLTNCVAPKNENIARLLEEIRSCPDQYWSLSIAAEKAGYSNFHLSRVFQVEVGMGFPEFVERARTEIAIQSLLSTLIPINQVTQLSGFGSSPSLRSACQEYTGFLPSELRGAAGE
ncbi:MAG: helix-turn-helix transcriptional regulator [Fimbriimonadaceae bacterium]|nr:helix-turn-helix transcriptional regulator [Fimbriimonadaceae bacterium]